MNLGMCVSFSWLCLHAEYVAGFLCCVVCVIIRYQEILTDPSYAGQFVLMTNPHIGNTGINFG